MVLTNQNPTETEKLLFRDYGLYLIESGEWNIKYAPVHTDKTDIFPVVIENLDEEMVEWTNAITFDKMSETVTLNSFYDIDGFFSLDNEQKPCTASYWDHWSKIKRKDMKWRPLRSLTEHELKYGYKTYVDAREEFKYELKEKEMLLKVCRKCLMDGFPLEEYAYWENPYCDSNGWIICFVHLEDYKEYHEQGKKDTKIREIDFWCPHNALKAIPQGLDNNSNQYDCETCAEAVYED